MKKQKPQKQPNIVRKPEIGKFTLIGVIGLVVSFPFTFTFVFWPYIGYTGRIFGTFPDEILYFILSSASFLFILTFLFYSFWAYYSQRIFASIEDNKTVAAYMSFLLNSTVMAFSVLFSVILKVEYARYFDDEDALGVYFIHFYLYIGGMLFSYLTSSSIVVIVTRKLLQI